MRILIFVTCPRLSAGIVAVTKLTFVLQAIRRRGEGGGGGNDGVYKCTSTE